MFSLWALEPRASWVDLLCSKGFMGRDCWFTLFRLLWTIDSLAARRSMKSKPRSSNTCGILRICTNHFRGWTISSFSRKILVLKMFFRNHWTEDKCNFMLSNNFSWHSAQLKKKIIWIIIFHMSGRWKLYYAEDYIANFFRFKKFISRDILWCQCQFKVL